MGIQPFVRSQRNIWCLITSAWSSLTLMYTFWETQINLYERLLFLRCIRSTLCVNPWVQWLSCLMAPSVCTAKEPLRSCWRSEWWPNKQAKTDQTRSSLNSMEGVNVRDKRQLLLFLSRCSYILDANGESRSFRPRDRDEMVKQVRLVNIYSMFL